ncbi:MAG: hypothetical protein EOP48_19235 [Sphingobacteriales bacterium]|nr:MAG: hypothetical protein EOP48_19235 [Sphingobacteriales bacterium]
MNTLTRGEKLFELSNHLGNVLVTVSDKRVALNISTKVDSYEPDVRSASDYAPFGMQLVGRKWSAGSYRYGFNGKENDNEVKGEGNQQDYGLRIYDPRLGKFLSVDPLTSSYPWYTPYQFAGNDVIRNIDLDGGEPKPSTPGTQEGQTETTSERKFYPRGSVVVDKAWYWHNGGLGTGKLKNANDISSEIKTEAGWYSSEGYLDVLSSSSAAQQLAGEAGYSQFVRPGAGAKESLGGFVGVGLNENASKYLNAAALKVGAKANFMASGYTAPSDFNVEDFLVIPALVKASIAGVKMIGNHIAKNLASKGINYIRAAYSIGKTRNIASLGGEIEGVGFYSIGISGQSARAGTVGVPVLRRFTTQEVGGYDRLFDSEVKVLEDFANQFHKTPNVKGTLTLTSERTFCTSCSGVIDQFKQMFPNVKVNTINGVK